MKSKSPAYSNYYLECHKPQFPEILKLIAYPTKRVIIWFTLCPALPGPAFFIWVMASEITNKGKFDEVIYLIGVTFYMCLVSSIFGVILFGVPSLILALIYAGLKLTKRFLHVMLIIVLGGFVAMGWCLVTPFEEQTNLAFLLGSVTSLIMALFALPKPDVSNPA